MARHPRIPAKIILGNRTTLRATADVPAMGSKGPTNLINTAPTAESKMTLVINANFVFI